MDIKVWWAYLTGCIAASISDNNLSAADAATKVIELKESSDCRLTDDEFCTILTSPLNLNDKAKVLDFINQIIIQRSQYKKGLFTTKLAALQGINASLATKIAEITAYEQEFGKDVTSTSNLLTCYLNDGYEKNEIQIKQLMSDMGNYMRIK